MNGAVPGFMLLAVATVFVGTSVGGQNIGRGKVS